MNTRISERINKLLNLATSSNENEAKAAANKAAELMLKHNLTSQDIATSDYEEGLVNTYKRASIRSKYVHDILGKHYFVNVVTHRQVGNRSTVKIYGKKENVEIASYVYNFLDTSFLRLWNIYKKENGCGIASKQSYMHGLWKGISQNLEATRAKVENETGLVVVKDNGLETWQRSKIGSTSSSKKRANVRDRNAMSQGIEAGKGLRISKGINSGHSGKTLSLA